MQLNLNPEFEELLCLIMKWRTNSPHVGLFSSPAIIIYQDSSLDSHSCSQLSPDFIMLSYWGNTEVIVIRVDVFAAVFTILHIRDGFLLRAALEDNRLKVCGFIVGRAAASFLTSTTAAEWWEGWCWQIYLVSLIAYFIITCWILPSTDIQIPPRYH